MGVVTAHYLTNRQHSRDLTDTGVQSELSKITKASYTVLIACIIAHFLNHVYSGVLAPFLPLIREELSLSLTQAGILTSVSIATMTILHLFVGYLADKDLREVMIATSIMGASISVVLMSFVPSFIYLVLVQFILGISISGYHPSAFPAIAESFPKESRAKAVGASAMGGLIGMTVVPLLGALFLILFTGWKQSLLVLGLIGLVLFVPTVALLRYSRANELPDVQRNDRKEGQERWSRKFGLALIVTALRGIPFRCTTLLMPLYLVVNYGYEPIWAGSLTTIMLVSGMVAEIISAPISDKSGERVKFISVSMGLVVPFLLLLNFSLSPMLLIVVLIGIGFFFFFGVPPEQAYQTEICPADAKGLAFGVLFSIGALPGAISPIIFGAIGDFYGLDASILFLVAISLIATVVTLFMSGDSRECAASLEAI